MGGCLCLADTSFSEFGLRCIEPRFVPCGGWFVCTCVSVWQRLSALIKDRFGGLKKFFESLPAVFVVGSDHPFNPRVCLRRHLHYYPLLTHPASGTSLDLFLMMSSPLPFQFPFPCTFLVSSSHPVVFFVVFCHCRILSGCFVSQKLSLQPKAR